MAPITSGTIAASGQDSLRTSFCRLTCKRHERWRHSAANPTFQKSEVPVARILVGDHSFKK
jgi:hypothetical protein